MQHLLLAALGLLFLGLAAIPRAHADDGDCKSQWHSYYDQSDDSWHQYANACPKPTRHKNSQAKAGK
jgi:hypothetical protein